MSISRDEVTEIMAYPEQLKRMIKRRFGCDLDNRPKGNRGKSLDAIPQQDYDAINFAATVYSVKQGELDRCKGVMSDFLSSIDEMKELTNVED